MKFVGNIIVKEDTIDAVLEVHENIVEFDDSHPSRAFFEDRYNGLKHVIILAYYNNIPVGYIIGYEIDESNFYCWLAGVDYRYRRKGVLTAMMNYLKEWSICKGYEMLSIKTRNRYREMLSYLVDNNWFFVSVEEKGDIENYRINLMLNLR